MQTKLTLRLDEAVIEKAKAWARTRRISLSRVVSEFFAQLPEPQKKSKSDALLSPWTRSLIGVVTDKAKLTDPQIRDEYRKHLEEKHR